MGSQQERGDDGGTHGHRQHHMVVFPFMAQGHIIPTVALATRLATLPHTTVTVTATPRNAAAIVDSLPAGTPVRLHVLPFHGPDHGLPPGAENTDSIPYPLMINLFDASLSLRPSFRDLLNTILSDCNPERVTLTVVADMILGWTVEVAREVGAACHATLLACGGYGGAAYLSLWQNLPYLHLSKDDDDLGTFGTPGFPESFRLRRDQLPQTMLQANGADPWSRFLQTQMALSLTSDAVLCNSVEELEPFGMRLLRGYTKLPVWAVGPLFLEDGESRRRSQKRAGKKTGVSVEACSAWLDTQPAGSVLYVCFGSQNTVTGSQMLALATALEASGVAFLWVVRPPIGQDLGSDFRDEWLPPGFQSRVRDSGKGLVVRNWAPQPEILAHAAVGAFLSHCGWNSTLEALGRGVPIVGWPMQAEQFCNAKMLVEELGVCVEIARGVVRDVGAEPMEKVVREVMLGEKGREMRRTATRLAVVIHTATMEDPADGATSKKGSSARALQEFINFALSGSSTVNCSSTIST